MSKARPPDRRLATANLHDIQTPTQAQQAASVLSELRRPGGPWLLELPGGIDGHAARTLREQTLNASTPVLRRTVDATVVLLARRPHLDPQAHHAARRRYGRLVDEHATEEDWITRLRGQRRALSTITDSDRRRQLDAEIVMRRQRRDRLATAVRHAEAVVDTHRQEYQTFGAWHELYAHELAQGEWHARELAQREERALALAAAEPPAWLRAALGPCPSDPSTREPWKKAALAVLRFRVEHRISDPQRALGPPIDDSTARLHRGQVEGILDQTRQLISNDCRIEPEPIDPWSPDLEPPG